MNGLHHYRWVLPLLVTVLGWLWVAAGERAVTQAQLSDVRRQIESLQSRDQASAGQLAAIRAAISEVQTDLRWIRAELAHLRRQREMEQP